MFRAIIEMKTLNNKTTIERYYIYKDTNTIDREKTTLQQNISPKLSSQEFTSKTPRLRPN